MNAEEIVKAAMSCVERDCWRCIRRDNEPSTEDECRRDLLNHAAVLIESLTAQLAEARKREKAAVEDMQYYLENNEENGVVFIPKFAVKKITNWRGPQKGEGK